MCKLLRYIMDAVERKINELSGQNLCVDGLL
jgi:hypothetical protein